MMTAVLTTIVVFFLFYGRLPLIVLVMVSIGTGMALLWIGKHKHTPYLLIDSFAQTSRLKMVNSTLKFWTVISLMVLCVIARGPLAGIFLAVVMCIFIVFVGGLAFHNYINLLSVPVSFLMVSVLALLFEVTGQRTGLFGIRVFGIWFCIGAGERDHAVLVMTHALGAVSCLYLLSLTTPMSELIAVLRRMHCPDILIELMYLIYRYIFILLSMYHSMQNAAASRLGYADYRAGIRTTGNLYSNLLSRSYRQASRNFEAMESRCYDTGIRFLENTNKVTGVHLAIAVGIMVLTFGLSLFVY